MLQVGKVKKYNEERGFGFIAVDGSKSDLFFHIKDFPKGNKPPQIGERLTFNIQQYENKLKATNIERLDFPKKQTALPKAYVEEKEGKFDILGTILVVGFVSILVYFIYGFIKDSMHRSELADQPVIVQTSHVIHQKTQSSNIESPKPTFNCDGRIHCPQMTSKDEAIYFINNCPGTKMDGDGDGDPCEDQFRSNW